MAILRIESSNQELSYIIEKNPNSGLFPKSVKQGVMFGYFPRMNGVTDTTQYVIRFADASDAISYKKHPDEQFEYLNASKYNNARFINDAIQEILHSAREKDHKEDVPAKHVITVYLCETHYKTIDIFQRYFPEVKITSTEVSTDNYTLVFETVGLMKLRRLLQLVNLFGMFATLNSKDYTYLTEDLIKKYVRIANELDVPYFIRYLIKIRMARSEKKYNLMKAELEKSGRYKIEMEHGDTHEMRINWIKGELDAQRSIVDIGAGIDYRYLKIFAPMLKDKGLKYYAIEIDLDARERIKAGIRNRNLEDVVELFESVNDFIDYYRTVIAGQEVDVICTEVLQHNEHKEAVGIVRQVSTNINYNNFIITVPNADFNQFYGLDGFRHDDHKWEATMMDVQKLIPDASQISAVISSVGDRVNDIPVSYGLILTKQEEYAQV